MAEPRARRSIRRALLLTLLLSVMLIWGVTAIVSYLDARHEIDELLDAHLAQSASLLIAQVGHELEDVDVEHSPQLHPYERRVTFQLWEGGSVLRLHSANAPNTRLSRRDEGFDDVVADGTGWRVFSAWDPGRQFLVQVGERQGARTEIAAKIAKNLLLPLAVALPLLGLLIWIGIDRALRPVQALSGEIARRAPDKLDTVDASETPIEVAPLVESLNRLFERVSASMDNERRFTADAAHELRTPLAALRAQAQVARGSTSDAERDRALANVIAACDRASHLVDQLLTLARLEPETFHAQREDCDLRAIARDVIADLGSAALARGIDVALDDGPPVTVRGDVHLLHVLVRNIVDNAIRYSAPGSAVSAAVASVDGQAFVTVSDQGPGIPAAERESLGRRFHRLPGNEAGGTGLGLSIAKRIADLHGATITYDEGEHGRGLRVRIAFPC